MGGVREGERREAVVALFVVLISAGACAHRPHQPGPETPVPVESPTTVQAPPPQPVYTGPLRLYEVRVIETAGTRSILFRFSRPPEVIDYFPLRSPSRLVIDVKGPIEALAKVHSYKATDSLVFGVRVGSYQGRIRLVVDLAAAEAPQFSVDNYETLVTAFLGEKNDGNKYAERNAQVLFIANEARNSHVVQATPAVDKVLIPPVKQASHAVTTADMEHREVAHANVPVEKVTPPAGAGSLESPHSGKGQNAAKVGEAVSEESLSSVPAEEEPVEVVQAPGESHRPAPKI